MSRGYTKEQRLAAKEAALDAAAPQLVVDGNRIYLVQKLAYHGEVRVDATGLYHFLKEMFTTDWESQLNKITKEVK